MLQYLKVKTQKLSLQADAQPSMSAYGFDGIDRRDVTSLQGKRRIKLPTCAFKTESCARMWRETDSNKKIVFAAAITAVLLLIFIIVSTLVRYCIQMRSATKEPK